MFGIIMLKPAREFLGRPVPISVVGPGSRMVPERTPLDGLARLRCQVRLLQFTVRMTCQLHDFSEFTLSILPPGFLKQSLSRRQMVRGVNVVRGMKELSEAE